jgi:hypothetical protein
MMMIEPLIDSPALSGRSQAVPLPHTLSLFFFLLTFPGADLRLGVSLSAATDSES